VVLAAFSVFGILVGFGTDSAAEHPSKVAAAIKLAVALLLLWLGLRAAVSGPRSAKPRGEGGEPRLGRAFALGAALMATNVTTLALYFPAMHDIGISDVSAPGQLAAAVLTYAITMSFVVLPPLTIAALGDRGRTAIDRLGDFMNRHQRAISTAVPLLFAVVLAVETIPVLA
jgi:threonine/homoserine/homoserine lactone efflux protein